MNAPATVDAVVYFRVVDPVAAVIKVEYFLKTTSLIAQTPLRGVLGQAELDELLARREKINRLAVPGRTWGATRRPIHRSPRIRHEPDLGDRGIFRPSGRPPPCRDDTHRLSVPGHRSARASRNAAISSALRTSNTSPANAG